MVKTVKRAIGMILFVLWFLMGLAACGTQEEPATSDTDQDYNYELTDSDITTDEETGVSYVNNILVIFFADGTSASEIDEVVESVNGSIEGKMEFLNQVQVRIQTSDSEELERLCEQLQGYDCVDYCTYDFVIDEDSEELYPEDPWGNKKKQKEKKEEADWGQMTVEAPAAWALCEKYSSGTVIGVVDSGIDWDHEDLADRGFSIHGGPIRDHGTHVAGIIGATANNNKGIAGLDWHSKILRYNCYRGRERRTTTTRIVNGMSALVRNGAKIINVSQGGSDVLTTHNDVRDAEYLDKESEFVSRSIGFLLNNGYDFVVVQSSGNGASDGIGVDARNNGIFCAIDQTNCDETFANAQEVLDRIIIVGNAKQENGKYIQNQSSNGMVSIYAPGTDILSAIPNNRYEMKTGTSMAAPFVSGIAGMVWGVNPSLTGAEVKHAICDEKNTSIKVSNNPVSPTSGNGNMVNAYLAVRSVLPVDHSRELYEQYLSDIRAHSSGREDGKLIYDLEDTTGNPADFRQLYEQYAIADIDSDGQEELVVWFDDKTMNETYMIQIFRADTESDSLELIGSVCTTGRYSDHTVFWANGVIGMKSDSGDEERYYFLDDAVAEQYDFSGRHWLAGGLNHLVFFYNEDGVDEEICGTFDVSALRTISKDQAEEIVSSIQGGGQVNVDIVRF